MDLKNWNYVACLALLLPIIAAAGCTGSDVLTPRTGSFMLQVESVNIPEGYRFGDGDRDRARFTILQIELRPSDPNAAAVLGEELGEENTLNLLRSPVSINHDVSPKFIWDENNILQNAPPPLTTGRWILDRIVIERLQFRDRDETDPSTCFSYIDEYETVSDDGTITFQDFSPAITFDIDADSPNQYSLVVDWGALTTALQESWPCYPGCGAWCIVDYYPGIGIDFASRLDEYITFQ
jgi:hypothetical protein